MNIRQKILVGGILFALLLALILSYNNYQRFTVMITQDYSSDALLTAQTALTVIDADNFSVYSQDPFEHKKIIAELQNLADTQDAMFIYVIEPFNDYQNIRFGVNVRNSKSDYDNIPLGYVMPTSSEDYKKAYRDLYEGVTDYAFVVRDNGISKTGDHVTALIPINSAEKVQGILCVQWQMEQLDAEKIHFLKRTVSFTLICLLLMFFVGKKISERDIVKSIK